MGKQFIRKPIGNFFIMRDLQIRLIWKIVLAVLLGTLVFGATMLITYMLKYQDVAFYRVTLQGDVDISDRFNIVVILLPSIIISSIVNIAIGFAVGLFASRKYAVPIYKLEQWASLLRDGNMAASLRFREKEEMQNLSQTCNDLSKGLRQKFLAIKEQAESLKKNSNAKEADAICSVLDTLELESEMIEVHTTYARIPKDTDSDT